MNPPAEPVATHPDPHDPLTGPRVLTLSDAALDAALAALPPGAATHVFAVAGLSPARDTTESKVDEATHIAYYACTGGSITIYVGHTDPEAMQSVYDGSVATSIPCGG